jgi:hypothetical protein
MLIELDVFLLEHDRHVHLPLKNVWKFMVENRNIILNIYLSFSI